MKKRSPGTPGFSNNHWSWRCPGVLSVEIGCTSVSSLYRTVENIVRLKGNGLSKKPTRFYLLLDSDKKPRVCEFWGSVKHPPALRNLEFGQIGAPGL